MQAYGKLLHRFPSTFHLLPSTLRILDLGCGTGELARALAGQGFQVTGIDISEASLAVAREQNPGVSFQNADMTALPFPNSHFDAVIAMTSLEFCRDKITALREIKRVLKPGGYLYAEVRNGSFILNRMPPAFTALLTRIKLLQPYPAENFRDLSHAEWQALLREAGFTLECEFPSLRPWAYGGFLTRLKNLLIETVKQFLPPRSHYMMAFLCRR